MYHITAKVARGKEGEGGCSYACSNRFRISRTACSSKPVSAAIWFSVSSVRFFLKKIGPDIALCRALSDPRPDQSLFTVKRTFAIRFATCS